MDKGPACASAASATHFHWPLLCLCVACILSSTAKKPYEDRAEKLKAQYEKDIAVWKRNHPDEVRPPLTARAWPLMPSSPCRRSWLTCSITAMHSLKRAGAVSLP